MESKSDMLRRVRMMADGNPTWDLSDNDTRALQHVLAERHEFKQASDLADLRIRELEAELASAREDSARLDAIQRGSWTVHYRSMHSRWEVMTDHAHPAHRKTYTGKTARAAIDAARKGEQDAK